ncbi:hypothetical protein FDA52_06805 [Clostridium botulinum]|nr:hypothetical protein [Clostridium botulinum]
MGTLVKNLNQIVKKNKLICSNINCNSNNVKIKYNINKANSIDNGIYEFECEECGEEFAFITTHGSNEDIVLKELI